jgi:threonine dehydratase
LGYAAALLIMTIDNNGNHFHDISRADIEAARGRIAGDVRHTPLMRIAGRQLGIDCAELWLKLEHLQVGGSFKARGMFNRMRSNPLPGAGVVIASGGNAGIAAAVAARAMDVRCEVFVPETASQAKRDKLAELGAVLTVYGASYSDALAASLARQAQTGALLMHAYDQREVVIGAGTLAAEVELDAGVPDRVLVSVGGGGLIAGIAAWFQDQCWIDALEPELAPTLFRARETGRPVDVEVSGIAADSLGARRIGGIAWEMTQRYVDAAHLLGDADIRAAQGAMWKELRLAVEPAAALPLAALTSLTVPPQSDERVLMVICGANLDLASLAT